MPKRISVVVPCYNGRRYLDDCLRSVAEVDDGTYEVVVVDDGSTEPIADVVDRWAPLARYLRQSNQGPGAARNHGIAATSGEYVRFLDCDDTLLPTGALREQVVLLDEHPEVGLVYGQAERIDGHGRAFGRRRPTHAATGYRHTGEEELPGLLLLGNYMTTSTIVARRSALEAAGPFRTDLLGPEDWDCWLRVAQVAGIAYVAQPVAGYRSHGTSITANYSPDRWLAMHHDILDRTFADPRFPAQHQHLRAGARARLDGVAAQLAYSHERMDLARGYALRALASGLRERRWRRSGDAAWLTVKSLLPVRLRRPLRQVGHSYRLAASSVAAGRRAAVGRA